MYSKEEAINRKEESRDKGEELTDGEKFLGRESNPELGWKRLALARRGTDPLGPQRWRK